MKHTLAKVAGWAFFVVVSASQLIASQGAPHGAAGWLTILGSLLGAAGIHAASSTDGQK